MDSHYNDEDSPVIRISYGTQKEVSSLQVEDVPFSLHSYL